MAEDEEQDPESPGLNKKKKNKKNQQSGVSAAAAKEANAQKQVEQAPVSSSAQQNKHQDAWHAFIRYLHFTEFNL